MNMVTYGPTGNHSTHWNKVGNLIKLSGSAIK